MDISIIYTISSMTILVCHLIGFITEPVLCKTVSGITEPCVGELCDQKKSQNQPEPQQMYNEKVNETITNSDTQAEESFEGRDKQFDDQGPDLDSMLHGGEKDVHSHSNKEIEPNASEPSHAEGKFGFDPEQLLHNKEDVHSHGTVEDKEDKVTYSHDYGTDLDDMLHMGDKHVHSPREQAEVTDKISEVPIGASDMEAMLHNGDRHAHDHSQVTKRIDQVPPHLQVFGPQDQESALHGPDGYHVHAIQQAVDGSRPLSGPKDPDVAGVDINPLDIQIGTLLPEDVKDYHHWKSEKEKLATKETLTGWLSGFSYITDAIFRDLQAVKKRYLTEFWSENKNKEQKREEKHDLPTHDEA